MLGYFRKKNPLQIILQPINQIDKTPPAPRATREKKFVFYSF